MCGVVAVVCGMCGVSVCDGYDGCKGNAICVVGGMCAGGGVPSIGVSLMSLSRTGKRHWINAIFIIKIPDAA